MTDEIELVSDGDGLAVFGEQHAVERFLESVGLFSTSKAFRLDNLGRILDAGGAVIRTASDVAGNSGRYLKLTKESAARAKELGLMPTKTKGISHAMLGEPGAINKWLQVESGPGSLLTNPALLSGIGGLMTQFAKQAEANELKALLVKIDEKLDDVRRTQRDSVLAKMDRAALAIKEALTIHEHGGNRETAWGKVESESGTIAEVQGSALRALDALADKVEGKKKVGQIANATEEIEFEVSVWLAVLARCFQLQDEFAVLEIDHVLDVAPADIDGHRVGLGAAQQERRALIIEKTRRLIERMDVAGAIADSNKLLHVRGARSVVDSVNATASSIDEFHAPLGIDPMRDPMEATRWRSALRDRQQLKNAGLEAGRKTLTGVAIIGATAVATVVSVVTAKNVSKGGD